jgi:hypothetical protein
MAELVDAPDSKSGTARCGGSIPSTPIGGSSNGRTWVFGAHYLGSNPSPPVCNCKDYATIM